MPDPSGSLQPLVRTRLAEYLTNETTIFFPDIDWQYYATEHDTTMSPRGAIFIDSLDADREYPGNLDNITKLYKIHVLLRLSKENIPDLLTAMEEWSNYLTDTALKKLQKEGYLDFFKGIHLRPRDSVIMEQSKNQLEGGKGVVHWFLLWDDSGATSSQPWGAFTI